MKKTAIKLVKITNSQGRTKEISSKDLLSIQTSKSIMNYAGTFDIIVDNTGGKNSKLCEPKDEVEIWLGYKETEIGKVMGGFIDRVILEKSEESKETMRLQGRSYSSVLLDSKVSGKIHYAQGYSQVLRELLKETPLKPKGILDTEGKGTIVLRNVPLIDVVRQIAEEMVWTFEVDHDKVFHFKPVTPPKKSGITLTDKDIKSFRFVKESK
jgi:hypothetical protein